MVARPREERLHGVEHSPGVMRQRVGGIRPFAASRAKRSPFDASDETGFRG
jgi:hypothetical protein